MLASYSLSSILNTASWHGTSQIHAYQWPTSSAGSPTPSITFTSLGCYVDSWTHILSGASMISSTNSPYTCSAYCNQQSFPYFGVEYCKYCSHSLLHKFQH